MNQTAENRLGCSRTPEPDIRLRKGHQLDGTRRSDNDSHQRNLEPVLEASVLSSHHKKISEEHECNDEASQEDEGFMGMSPLLQAHHAMERMEEFVCKVWEGRWRVIPHDVLPDWLKDNDFLLHGHRPPMPSFRACFKSIFRIHTETGNIWTHLLGCVFFLCLGIFYMFRPNISFVAPLQEKVVFGLFFLGAILCLSFSWLFHTVYCHSEGVSRLFSKLDYSGIALLIMGSFVPWLYYSFYCNPQPCFIYLIVICVLGIAAIIVSQWDMFATPQYRGVRAGVFLGLGLSGIIPTLHYVIAEGFLKAATIGQIGWLMLMASLYITGAALYAARIPERFFPGKCDIWEQLLRHELPELMSLIIDQRVEDRAPHLTSLAKVEGKQEPIRWQEPGLGLTPDAEAHSASSGAMVRAALGLATASLWPRSACLVDMSLHISTCDVGRPYHSRNILEINNTPERHQERWGVCVGGVATERPLSESRGQSSAPCPPCHWVIQGRGRFPGFSAPHSPSPTQGIIAKKNRGGDDKQCKETPSPLPNPWAGPGPGVPAQLSLSLPLSLSQD
uniref:Adiponectin receptor 2 n=3 Tax=Laurasiatheria TaxID=314145 RepID=A0A8C0NXT1_CANLF